MEECFGEGSGGVLWWREWRGDLVEEVSALVERVEGCFGGE